MACAVTSAGGGDRGAVCPPICGIRSTPIARVTTLIEVATGRQIARRGRIRGQQRQGDKASDKSTPVDAGDRGRVYERRASTTFTLSAASWFPRWRAVAVDSRSLLFHPPIDRPIRTTRYGHAPTPCTLLPRAIRISASLTAGMPHVGTAD